MNQNCNQVELIISQLERVWIVNRKRNLSQCTKFLFWCKPHVDISTFSIKVLGSIQFACKQIVSPILLQYMMLKSHQQPNRQGDLVLCNSSGTESRAHAGKAKHRKIHSCEKCTLAPKYFNWYRGKIQVKPFCFLNL